MNQINNIYQIIQQLYVFNEKITLWLCENADGDYFEVLTIGEDEVYGKLMERLLLGEVKPLLNRDIVGIQKVLEVGRDVEQQCYFIVYEYLEGYQLLEENTSNETIKSLKIIAGGLDLLKKENRQAFVINPQSIAINISGHAKLKYIGLFELFSQQQLHDVEYLAPNVTMWLTDKKQPRPNFQDDIYALVKSFENVLRKTLGEAEIEILLKSLAENRIERFSKYHELLVLLEQIPVLRKKQIFKTRPTIKISTQRDNKEDFQPILTELNEEVWFLVETKRAEKSGQITGRFSTKDWNGRFFVDEKRYLFIDFKGCRNHREYRVIKDANAFVADFNFDFDTISPFDCVAFFQQKIEEQNQLAELHSYKKNQIKLWQTLPEKEHEYIEEKAFNAKYKSREVVQNSNNIKFKLTEDFKNWEDLKRLKNTGIFLFIGEQCIGSVLDFHPSEKFIIIKDAYCSVDEISNDGNLIEDVRQETSQYKKQVEACKKFEESDIVNPILSGILATPDDSEMPKNATIYDYQYDEFKNTVFNQQLKQDETQREAVLEALHHKPVYLIQGPPGTGKTTVIVELIQQILKTHKEAKILVTSQSNLAVDNVLERLEAVNQSGINYLKYMRLASEQTLDKDNISATVLPHTLENKLKNWVTTTTKSTEAFFFKKFNAQQKQKQLIDFFDSYSVINGENGMEEFNKKLRFRTNYIKKLFEDAKSLKDAKKIFEAELGKEFIVLKQIQRDWIAFLGAVLNDDDDDGRKKSMLNNGSTEIDFLTAMMLEINIIGATCIHIASSKYSKVNFRFDYVIMDESSKASPAETLVPINMGQNIILIGDHKQLPPVITREEAVKKKVKEKLDDNGLDFDKDFGESLFEKLITAFENDEHKSKYIKMLDIQYRMPKQVGSLISKYFYEGKLKNPEVSILPEYDKDKLHGLKLKKETSVFFYSTSDRERPYDNDNKLNRSNTCNVETVKELLEKLNVLYVGNNEIEKPLTIGIIAGYRGQVDLLKKSINLSVYSNFIIKDKDGRKSNLIEINTVDKFQGAERDIIIYDIVRSSMGQSNIGFLDDYRRINVAFSRVKRLLIVVGDSEYLIKRATLNPNGKFKEFKLQEIAKELQENGLTFNNLEDIF